MARSVGVYEAKTNFSKLLEEVVAGEEVVITRRGTEVARLVPGRAPKTRVFGRDEGVYELPENFDDPLPEEIQAAFEGRGT